MTDKTTGLFFREARSAASFSYWAILASRVFNCSNLPLFDVYKTVLVLYSLRQQVFEQLFAGPGLIGRPCLNHYLMLDPENHIAGQGEDVIDDVQRRFPGVVMPEHMAAAFEHVGLLGGTELVLSCDAVALIAV
ncbi:hypothetical protein CDV31_001618 [Fusarium ambrosium]|uniref:Uncharacterized protein n=1 Tax=Fusarium ambrosium TaxID=131363 RepID=A0A428UYS5_9HYPO|nr:hypothetical protein CDV31_001618 [Fusarium ambrosium]